MRGVLSVLAAGALAMGTLGCGEGGRPAATPMPPAAPPPPSVRIGLIPGTHQLYEGARVQELVVAVMGEFPATPVSVRVTTDAPSGQLELPAQVTVGESESNAFEIKVVADNTPESQATYQVNVSDAGLPGGLSVAGTGVTLVVNDAPAPACQGLTLTGVLSLVNPRASGRLGQLTVSAPAGTMLDFAGPYTSRFAGSEEEDAGVPLSTLPAVGYFYPLEAEYLQFGNWFEQKITLGWFDDLHMIARAEDCEPIHLECNHERCLTH